MAENNLQDEPVPGRYRHYKGGEYEVIGTARHSETDERLVVYRCLSDNYSLWVRPLAMFVEQVIVEGREVPRFTRCTQLAEQKKGAVCKPSSLPPKR